jgi:hypothetical protein
LKTKYNKEYFEKYAQIILSKVINKDYENLTKSERPDFHDNNTSIGLEVTQGMSTYEGNFNSFFNDNSGKVKTKEELLEEAKKRKLTPFIHQEGKITIYSSTVDLQCVNKKKKIVSESIITKLKKLNKHYKTFKSNELFVFVDFSYNKFDIEEIIEIINFNMYKIKFDKIYLLCWDHIYIYKLKENFVIEVKIEEEILKRTKQEAFIPR